VGVRQQNLVDDVPVGVVEEDEAQQQEEVCLEALKTLLTSALSGSLSTSTKTFKLLITKAMHE
jgi:hypothetical protein